MARARNIKPAFYKNIELSECSIAARLLFPGLWMLADREGKLKYSPKFIKAEIFPYDNIDCVVLLEELREQGLIIRYTSETQGEIIKIPNFIKHQKPHQNEVASELPDEGLGAKVESTCDQGAKHLAPPPSSPILNDEPPTTGVLINQKSGYSVIHHLSEVGLAEAKRRASGWDIYHLAGIYDKGLEKRGGPPKNPNAAFPAWVEKYTKGVQL